MSCLAPATLADFSTGKLAERDEERVREHMATCARCQDVSQRVKRITGALQAIADTAPPSLMGSSAARLEATLRWNRHTPEAMHALQFAPRRRVLLRVAGALALVGSASLAFVAVARVRGQHEAAASSLARQTEMTRPELRPSPPVVAERLRAVVTLASGIALVSSPGVSPTPIDINRTLTENDRVTTSPGARIAFQWGEGSGVLVDENSELSLTRLEARAQELSLTRGRVSVRVGPHQPGESMRVVSPDHTVSVHGTWFEVAADACGTQVQVLEGVVEIAARAGETASTQLRAPSRGYFPRERGVAEGERALSGHEASALRTKDEMGLLAWAAPTLLLDGTGILPVTSEPAAELVVDGVGFGETPLRLRRTRGERHLVELSRPGFATVRRWVTIGDAEEDLHLALPRDKLETTPADLDEVRQVVANRRRQIAACYEHALKRDPGLAGTVTLDIHIGPAGQVLATKKQADTLGDVQVIECIRREAAGWAFARARNATIVYPFVFRSP